MKVVLNVFQKKLFYFMNNIDISKLFILLDIFILKDRLHILIKLLKGWTLSKILNIFQKIQYLIFIIAINNESFIVILNLFIFYFKSYIF